MKKKTIFSFLIIFSLAILSGCSLQNWREEGQIKDTANNFLKAMANQNYKTITGTEASKYSTPAARKRLSQKAITQVNDYKSAKGTSYISGNPKFKITKKTAQEARVETVFNLNLKSESRPALNGVKKYGFRANLKKSGSKWLVDTWDFKPEQ